MEGGANEEVVGMVVRGAVVVGGCDVAAVAVADKVMRAGESDTRLLVLRLLRRL